ncbi:MAG TPA: SDR family NAD(P)-dependent oxidoreductase [Chloroflexota bacterium]|jgi:NAD(P)-dependent dehydrogenase (short-subunit alcohol dehydrogenase family)
MNVHDSAGVVLLVGVGGIGAATATRLARDGYALALADNVAARAEQSAATLEQAGTPVLPLTVDARDEGQVAAMVAATVDRFGQIDALVTTVGGAEQVTVAEMTLRQWTDMLAFNLTSQFLTARAVLPVMRQQQRGSIVAVASNLAWGKAGMAHYAAAKAGIIGFVRSLALEVAGEGIRVNAYAPGFTHTQRIVDNTPAAVIEANARSIPMGRLGLPEEQADGIAFLVSPASRYVTGQVLHVNGGWLMP